FTSAQIINPSFENWTTGNPDGWTTGNAGPYTFVLESNDAHDGSLAVLDRVVSLVGINFASPLCYGPLCMGAQTSTAPQAIHGWYKMTSFGSDYVDATAALFDNSGTGTGAGLTTFSGSDVYKEFVINLYYTSGVPNGDSLLIDFILINDTAGKVHSGSSFTLDDLSFGALSGVGNVLTQSSTALESISPNPSYQSFQIIYNVTSEGETQLDVYDVSGQLVKNVVDEHQGPGRYKAIVDVSDLPQGIYFCKLVSGSSTDFLKMEIQR
ncbi:MAG: T9SS type A sorting domain-containing protein, partial [Chitinophagales bacterium]